MRIVNALDIMSDRILYLRSNNDDTFHLKPPRFEHDACISWLHSTQPYIPLKIRCTSMHIRGLNSVWAVNRRLNSINCGG